MGQDPDSHPACSVHSPLASEASDHRLKVPEKRITGMLRTDTRPSTEHTPLARLEGTEAAGAAAGAPMRLVSNLPQEWGNLCAAGASAPSPQWPGGAQAGLGQPAHLCPDTKLCFPVAAPGPQMSETSLIGPAARGAGFK